MTVQVNEEGAIRPIRASYAYEKYVMVCIVCSIGPWSEGPTFSGCPLSVNLFNLGNMVSGFNAVSGSNVAAGALCLSICSIWSIWSVVVVSFLKEVQTDHAEHERQETKNKAAT